LAATLRPCNLAAIKKSGSRSGPTLNFSLLSESYEISLSAI
jgi:hypothetical protein